VLPEVNADIIEAEYRLSPVNKIIIRRWQNIRPLCDPAGELRSRYL